jgi:integral membrane protein (TIGR01906 family)
LGGTKSRTLNKVGEEKSIESPPVFFTPNSVKFKNAMKTKILGVITQWLFILCLPVLLFTASLAWEVNSRWLYNYGFQKYSVVQSPELKEFPLEQIADELIDYFNSDEEYVSITVTVEGETFPLFTPEETIHYKDVKDLIRLDYWLLGGTLAYVLAYAAFCLFWRRKRHWQQLAWALVGGGGLTIALMLMLGLGALFGFNELFWRFHHIFFTNPFWYAQGYMLKLFTDDFFYDCVIFCALGSGGLALILGGLGGGYLLSTRKRL